MATPEGVSDRTCSSSGSSMKGSPEKMRKHSPHRDAADGLASASTDRLTCVTPDPSSVGPDPDSMDLDQVNDNIPDISEDNLSLEVNFDGSCRASDVSSLSFQNTELDDMDLDKEEPEGAEQNPSIHDSEDSDSGANYEDYDQPQFSQACLEASLNRKEGNGSERPRGRTSPVRTDPGERCIPGSTDAKSKGAIPKRGPVVGMDSTVSPAGAVTMDRGHTLQHADDQVRSYYSEQEGSNYGLSTDENSEESLDGAKRANVSPEAKEAIDALITHAMELMEDPNVVGTKEQEGVQWKSPTGTPRKIRPTSGGATNNRNSLEVRNNIPDVAQVKDYKADLSLNEIARLQTKAALALPKMKKQSPGLARRLPDGADSHSGSDHECSSSDREMTPVIDQSVTSAQEAYSARLQQGEGRSGSGSSREETPVNQDTPKINMDIENEYDYVKTARIQHGDAYVGMRLAYSSSQDSLKHNSVKGIPSSDDDHMASSREGSPEKLPYPMTGFSVSRMNEETFTEISLGSAELQQGDDRRNISLSPEATDCDSAEVESIISDGGQSSGCMPMVEDGLSSSQGSDEETATLDTNQPSEILKRRRKAEVESELNHKSGMEESSLGSSKNSTPSMQDSVNKDALDLAIRDIQSAIQQSKSASLKNSYSDNQEANREPVWVMRDAYQQRVPGDSIEEEIQNCDPPKANKGEQMQTEEHLPSHQYGAKNGKTYQQHRGYDSEEDAGYSRRAGRERTRWNKGRTYSAVGSQADDPTVQSAYRQPFFPSLAHSRYASEYTDGKRHGQHLISSSHVYRDNPASQSSTEFRDNPSRKLNRYTDSVNGSGLHEYRDQPEMPHSYTDNPAKPGQSSYASVGEQRSRSLSDLHKSSQGESSGSDEERDQKPNAYIRDQQADFDTDEETAELLADNEYSGTKVDIPELTKPPVNRCAQAEKRKTRAREAKMRDPDDDTVLIEGVLFRAKYLGSTQLISEGQPSKAMRMMQAQEAVGRIKAPDGENQPSTEVDLFVSTEKIMVLNTDLQEVMMDHSLRSISYIADIGEIIVIMARRRLITSPGDEILRRKKQSKILCHVFETDEAQLIAQSIGQAFQVAYMEFLKANGIDDPGLMKEMDYQDVLAQQEIFGEELQLFANKEKQKEVIVPKMKSEPLGVVIVESGWGSMVPTVVLANMNPQGAAARCGQLNIGDQIISVNGVSLVGLPLSSCQNYIKAVKTQTVVKLTVVSCPPVVEVLIKRPDVKYQLGFSVQNGVICSLLRGGIAERGGVRVGHRIIEINNQSVVAVAHEKIVSMLASSVGEIHMKTMPTSIFRLLTGQDVPHYI